MKCTRRNFLLASIGFGAGFPRIIKAGEESARVTFRLAQSKATSSSPTSVDLSRLLSCLAQVESGNRGPRPHQVTEIVWHQHFPSEPFYKCYGILEGVCAWKQLNWLRAFIGDHIYWLAYAWRAGLERTELTMCREIPISKDFNDYALRVVNLYTT